MEQYAGIDLSLEFFSVCIVDAGGKVIREAKVASERSALIEWFAAQGIGIARIGLEAGPLSHWFCQAEDPMRVRQRPGLRRLRSLPSPQSAETIDAKHSPLRSGPGRCQGA